MKRTTSRHKRQKQTRVPLCGMLAASSMHESRKVEHAASRLWETDTTCCEGIWVWLCANSSLWQREKHRSRFLSFPKSPFSKDRERCHTVPNFWYTWRGGGVSAWLRGGKRTIWCISYLQRSRPPRQRVVDCTLLCATSVSGNDRETNAPRVRVDFVRLCARESQCDTMLFGTLQLRDPEEESVNGW